MTELILSLIVGAGAFMAVLVVAALVERWAVARSGRRRQQEQAARHLREYIERAAYPSTTVVWAREARHPLDSVPYPIVPSEDFKRRN